MKKILISHRGNINGSNILKENHPDYINDAIKNGFNVEIDVWIDNNKIILGHDYPQYEINKEFIINDKFWVHAKNIQALSYLKEITNCFFHNSDLYTLTSKGWIWTYPGSYIISNKT